MSSFIGDDDVRAGLTYIDLITRTGAALSEDGFRAWMDHPRRRPERVVRERSSTSSLASMITALNNVSSWMGGEITDRIPEESVLEYCIAVRWVVSDHGGLTVTPVGRAALLAMHNPATYEVVEAQPVTVVTDPDDPLKYVRVLNLIGTYGPGLLIDPYFRLDGLVQVQGLSTVKRVLLSEAVTEDDRALVGKGVTALQGKIEVRVAAREALHDRFFIADQGDVFMLSGSLNTMASKQGIVVPLTDPAVVKAVRNHYEDVWNGSDLLPPEHEATNHQSP